MKGEDWELMEDDKLEETTEEEYKIMICPFCGKQEMCWLRYGMLGSERIPYYICYDCQTMRI